MTVLTQTPSKEHPSKELCKLFLGLQEVKNRFAHLGNVGKNANVYIVFDFLE